MHRLPVCTALAATALALACSAASAGRPSATENADVIDRGTCEVEPLVSSTRGGGVAKTDSWGANFTCGIGYSTQPFVTYTRSRSLGLAEESLALGAKSTLLAPQGGRPGLGVNYAIVSGKAGGTGWRTEIASIAGLATMEVATEVLLHANLGVTHLRDTKSNTTYWSVGVERTGNLTLAADLLGDDRSDGASVSVGVGYSFTPRFSANATYATGLEAPRLRNFAVGAKFVF